MADTEQEPKIKSTNSSSDKDQKRPDPVVTEGSLGELFSWMRLKAAMDKEAPGTSGLARLREIEEKLDSGDGKERLEGATQLQEVMVAKKRAEAQITTPQTVMGFLNASNVDEVKKIKLREVAADLDSIFEKSEQNMGVTREELNRAHMELQVVAAEVGIRENAVGLEQAMSKIHWLETAKEARAFVGDSESYVNPVAEYLGEFKPGDDAKVLKLTDVPADKADKLQRKLDGFKKHVSEDLMTADPKKIEDLTSDDLIVRLQETTYWQANMKDLQGSKKWKGNENIEQLRDMLGRVEAQYQALLEAKMVKDITSKHGEDNLSKDLIRESVVKSLRDRRRFLRTEYNFEKDVPVGKRAGEALEEEVFKGTRKMQQAVERHEPRQTTTRKRSYDVDGYNPPEGTLTPEESAERTRNIMQMQEKTTAVLKKLGIDAKMAKALKKSPTLREEILRKAEAANLTSSEMEVFGHSYEYWGKSGGGMRGELSAKQDELEALKGSKQYSKFLIKFKAYVERVGLREASSDWDFAIMMREAKEEISLILPDAGEKLDQWQEALFAPGLTSVDEKSFFEVMPKIMTQSRLEHEFSPTYANWEAMQVTGADGTKKVVSVAAFHQLLQREDNAKRILNAITNGNDSAIHQILVEHIWGPGASLKTDKQVDVGLTPKMSIVFADGRTPIENINVNYFSMQDDVFDSANPENMSIEDFVDQSMWMTHYAKTLWSFSGDWEPFVRDFPADQLTQANKRLANIGQAFRDYGLDYGKFDMGYVELAKAGVLLQPFSTYKISDVVKANLRRMLYDKGIETNYKNGDKYAEALAESVKKRAFISDKYNPVVAMRSVSEMRLMGNLPTGDTPADFARREELVWDWFKSNQEILGRKGVLNLADAQGLKSRYLSGENLSMDQESWAVQLIEMDKLAGDLVNQRLKLEKAGIPEAVLRELMDKQSLLTTGEKYEGPVNLETYLKKFEFSSIVDHAQLKKGTDPIDFKAYSEAKQAAAKLMTEVLSGGPTLEKINELYGLISSYMPPEQRIAWFEEFTKTRVKLRTNQVVSYEIAMTDLELWKMQRERGELKDADGKTIYPDHPPETVIGFNPATYKIKDKRGDSWNVIGADGFRVTKKKMERGNHMWKTREIPGLTAKDIEIEMKLYVGNRWLPNKAAGHHIVENSLGLSQSINQFYKNRGWDVEKSGTAKFVKKWGTKAIILLRQHPLFDDPTWAFWSILNEFYEYYKETSKEIQKELVGGH